MSDIVERAERRLSEPRLGQSIREQTDKDLAEMDEAKDEAQRWKERWQEAVRHADEAFAERDAALAKLDAVRAYAEMVTVPPYTRTAWHVLRILDDAEGSGQ